MRRDTTATAERPTSCQSSGPEETGYQDAYNSAPQPMRVLLVAENISLRQSGETSVPFYYLLHFIRLGLEVQAICHARVRDQLREDLAPDLFQRIHFIEDTWLQRLIYAAGKYFPYRVEDLVFNQIIHILTQIRLRAVARRLIPAHQIDVIFEPVPIAPKALSFMFGLRVPVVIGPMCGGLELPPGFRHLDGRAVDWTIKAARGLAEMLHRTVPGKLNAAALVVGNQRTARALPKGVRGKIHEVVESGVEIARWEAKDYDRDPTPKPITRFLFCGRLVDWKGAQYVVKAFAPLAREGGVHLDLIGDGELFDSIRDIVQSEDIADSVDLHGRVPLERYIALLRDADAYVMPSVRECGGLALLEAMAIGLPIVATNWMGPAEYLNDSSAILVNPCSEAFMVDGFTDAMRRLAASPELRRSLGEGARRRVMSGYFDWDRKSRRIVEILEDVVRAGQAAVPQGSSVSLAPAPQAILRKG